MSRRYFAAQSNGELRFYRNGETSINNTFMSGRLQIYLDGQWGNICDTGFGMTEATVACQQLTYDNATSFANSQNDRLGFVRIYMNELCENSLSLSLSLSIRRAPTLPIISSALYQSRVYIVVRGFDGKTFSPLHVNALASLTDLDLRS